MAKVHPAVAHYLCTECGDQIDIVIPIQVNFARGEDGEWLFRARVDPEAEIAQPFWDHRFSKHGPQVD